MAFPCVSRLLVTEQAIRGRAGAGRTVSILHLSDLHGRSFRRARRSLGETLRDLDPDIIALTGDILDERSASLEPVRRSNRCR